MSDKQETIADLIAEKRKRIEEIRCNLSNVPIRREEQLAEIECIEHDLKILEEAEKRRQLLSKTPENDNSAPAVYTGENSCNAAAMREAVGDLLYMAERYVQKTPATESIIFDAKTKKEIRTINYYDVIAKAKAAISAPPRNCDVGTEDEQADRFYNFCVSNQGRIDGMCDPKCPCIASQDKCHCLCKWSQMPYEAEGGCAE